MFSLAATMLVGLSGSAALVQADSALDYDFNSTISRIQFIQMCVQLKRMAATMEQPLPFNYTFILERCDRSSKEWFGRFYFELWQRSWEKRTLDKVLKYVNPTLLFFTLITILLGEVVLYRLDKFHKHAMWKLLLWYNSLTLAEYTIFYLPTFAAKNLDAYNLEHSIGGCKLLTFTRNVVANAPSWLLILLLVDQLTSMAARRRFTLTPFSVRCIMLGLIGALVVFNVHILWLVTYYPSGKPGARPGDGMCIINNNPVHSVVFIRIYPILLHVLHNLLPITMAALALLVFLVLLCLRRQCNRDVGTACLQGLSYVLFATPQNIEWLVRHVAVVKETKSLEEFKKNYTINVLAHTWSFFRYFFFVPILLLCNVEYRAMSLRLLTAPCSSQPSPHVDPEAGGGEIEEQEDGDDVPGMYQASEQPGPSASNDAAFPMLPMKPRAPRAPPEGEKKAPYRTSLDSFDSLDLACGCVRRARCSSSLMCVCECLPVYRQPGRHSPGAKPLKERHSSTGDERQEGAEPEVAKRAKATKPRPGCWPQGKFSSRYTDRVAFPLDCRCEWLRALANQRRRRRLGAGKKGSSGGVEEAVPVGIEDREAMAEPTNLNNYVIIVSQCPSGDENGSANVAAL